MSRRAAGLIGAALCAALAWSGTPAIAGSSETSTRCEGARRAQESAEARGAIPVLLVHGFFGAPEDFRRARYGRPSMLTTLASVDGAAVHTFDYSEHSSEWVTHQGIGPRLARAIRCLADEFDRQVVVVAHSMGGLATRLAQGQVLDGRAVAEDLRYVVTIGTPSRGVLLLTYSGDSFTAKIIQTLVDGAGELCADPADERKHQQLCELLDAANAPATTAMAPDAGALDALPAWGDGVTVVPIAADLRVRLSVFGVGTTVSIGDIVATVGSATAYASPGQDPIVVRCRIGLTNVPETVDRSPCAHGNELSNRRIIAAVRKQMEDAVRALERDQSSA